MKHQYSAGIIVYNLLRSPLILPVLHSFSEGGSSSKDENQAKKNGIILYLLLKYGAGHWDFPKGKIEKEETKQEAALRELTEETNLTAHIDDTFEETIQYIFMYEKETTQKTVYFFTGPATSTDVKLSHEHTDFAWLPYQDALNQLTYDNAKEILKKANKHNLLTI
jgi:8-oxo-dGTP pyrophosphatase MutT (NUDIX family)